MNGVARDRGDLVLPRLLRRPARALNRLRMGEVQARPFAMLMATLALFGATGLYGMLAGGHGPQVLKSVTAGTGFAVGEVRVSGNVQTSEIDVLQAVGLDGSTALLGLNAAETRRHLAALPWVEDAAVRKIYPGTLAVELSEKTPFAIWQHGSRLSLIERDGSIIAPFAPDRRFSDLPMVIGQGARELAPQIVAMVSGHPDIANQVRAYIRVGDRRWDLRLRNGVTIKLPEKDSALKLAELATLEREKGLFGRDIVSIDLRLPDRLLLGLSPEVAEAHEATMRERLGLKRKAGARI